MTFKEREIVYYLKASPQAFFSAREIARRAAGKKTYQESPNWVKAVLPRMVEKGMLGMDSAGHFRIKRADQKVEAKGRKWVSPQIARILKQSGKDFSEKATVELDEEDAGGR